MHLGKRDQAYLKMLGKLKKRGAPKVFANSSPSHAIDLIEDLLTNTVPSDYIGIYAGVLNRKAFGKHSVIKAINNILDDAKSNVELRIILERRPPQQDDDVALGEEDSFLDMEKFYRNPFYQEVLLPRLGKNKRVSLRVMKESALEVMKAKGQANAHIITTNNYSFRVETSDAKAEAYASLNDENLGKEVRAAFNVLWKDLSEEMGPFENSLKEEFTACPN